MRMVAGSVLILAACVLVSACWLGQVIHRPTTAGSSEVIYLPLAAGFLTVVGGMMVALGLFGGLARDREERSRE